MEAGLNIEDMGLVIIEEIDPLGNGMKTKQRCNQPQLITRPELEIERCKILWIFKFAGDTRAQPRLNIFMANGSTISSTSRQVNCFFRVLMSRHLFVRLQVFFHT